MLLVREWSLPRGRIAGRSAGRGSSEYRGRRGRGMSGVPRGNRYPHNAISFSERQTDRPTYSGVGRGREMPGHVLALNISLFTVCLFPLLLVSLNTAVCFAEEQHHRDTSIYIYIIYLNPKFRVQIFFIQNMHSFRQIFVKGSRENIYLVHKLKR